VSHEMITSGSPTEQFEICVSGAYFRGIWIPECGGHVTDRHNTQGVAVTGEALIGWSFLRLAKRSHGAYQAVL